MNTNIPLNKLIKIGYITWAILLLITVVALSIVSITAISSISTLTSKFKTSSLVTTAISGSFSVILLILWVLSLVGHLLVIYLIKQKKTDKDNVYMSYLKYAALYHWNIEKKEKIRAGKRKKKRRKK